MNGAVSSSLSPSSPLSRGWRALITMSALCNESGRPAVDAFTWLGRAACARWRAFRFLHFGFQFFDDAEGRQAERRECGGRMVASVFHVRINGTGGFDRCAIHFCGRTMK
jgi:hypothetical protein